MDQRGYTEVDYGAVTVLAAANGGAYPYGNTVVVRGSGGTLLVDPSLALDAPPTGVDAVVVSHAHEDHLVGLGRFAAAVHVHTADVAAVRSRAVMLAGYGLPEPDVATSEPSLLEEFRIADRPDAAEFADGHRFDLGDRSATVVHLPGHTAGHSGLLVEPDGFLYVADIDLTSFGPYYGDVGSDLEAFEASMRRCAEIDARWFGTFHQKGVIDGAAEFRQRLDAYRGVVAARDRRLLDLLARPRTVAEVVEQRLVYRPHVAGSHVEPVERRTAEQHIARLVAAGTVAEVEPGRFRVTAG